MVEADAGKVLRVRIERGPMIEVSQGADVSASPGQKVRVMVRPERIVDLSREQNPMQANRIEGRVTDTAYIGVSDKYRVVTTEGLDVLIRLPSGPSHRRYSAGEAIVVGFGADDARLVAVQ